MALVDWLVAILPLREVAFAVVVAGAILAVSRLGLVDRSHYDN